jgi:nucleotide-binding universal stress UspA family protein
MLPIKTILVATDFSPMSEHAFGFAGALARDYGARLVVVHVVRPPAAVYAETAVFVTEPDFSAAREALAKLRTPGVDVDHRLLEGEPGSSIVELAREIKCDLIVMGTHGRGGIVRVLLGSVAEEVLRKAPCPVLTVKATVAVPAAATEPAHEAAAI